MAARAISPQPWPLLTSAATSKVMTVHRDSQPSAQRIGEWLALACLLASCAVPPPGGDAPATSPPGTSKPTPAPRPTPAAPVPAPAAPAPPVVVTPAGAALSLKQANAAIDLLESGNEDQARAELQSALQNDPGNRLAQSLLRQITADPVTALGKEHFLYRVQPGESISRIAQRFLNDVHQFYILARYNDLPVPKLLQAGQMIKVPGRAPAPGSSPPPAPAPGPKSAESAPAQPPAASPTPSPSPAPAEAPKVMTERERLAKVNAATRAARSSYARQDLVSAIRHWDMVLELDPGNNNARIERQRAVDLKAKLDKL